MATLTTTPIKTFVSGETVTPTKLNELSQSAVALTAGTIVAGDLAADAVTTAKIADANVTTAKIADANVTTVKILDANVTTAKIADANVTTAKLATSTKNTIAAAWVHFQGSDPFSPNPSTSKIFSSFNVASITKNGNGNYTVNFQTALPNANYAAVVSSSNQDNGGLLACISGSPSTSSVNIRTFLLNGVEQNSARVSVVIFCTQ